MSLLQQANQLPDGDDDLAERLAAVDRFIETLGDDFFVNEKRKIQRVQTVRTAELS